MILGSVVFLGDDGFLHHEFEQLQLLPVHSPPFGVCLILLECLQVAQHAHQVAVVLLQVSNRSLYLVYLEGVVVFRGKGRIDDLRLPSR